MKTLLVLASLVVAASFAAGCGGAPERAAADTRPAADVRVVRAGALPGDPLVLPARVTAREEVTVPARMNARLTAMPLREGDHFRAGEVLATFDAPETRAALEGARAGLAAATLARDLARRQESRMDSLVAGHVAALRELEGAQAERRAAEAGWAQARAQVDQMQSGVTIEAPFAGVVVRRHADPGATVGPGQPLLDIRSDAAGEVTVSVPESDLPRLAGGRAELQVEDGEWRAARLLRVDGMTDYSTRSRVARFAPASGPAPEPGAFARVRLPGSARAARSTGGLTVPASALVIRGGLTGVYVAEGGVAHLRWLRTGREQGPTIEVLAGLAPGEDVIDDPAGLEDGRAIRVVPR
jgi:RND family efflux transporter MFP subunit